MLMRVHNDAQTRAAGGSRYIARFVSVCTPCARVSTRLDVCARAYTCPFRCVRRVHVCVSVWTCVHVHVRARLGVYALGTCVYASGPVRTCVYAPVSVCTGGYVCARACTCPIQGVRFMHVCVGVWTCVHGPVCARFRVFAFCTWDLLLYRYTKSFLETNLSR